MSIYDQWHAVPRKVKSLDRIIDIAGMLRLLLFTAFIFIPMRLDFHAQSPPLERLSPQNLYRLTQVGLIQRGTIEELAWSPDETQIVVGGSAGLRIYTINSGREQLLLGHQGAVNDVDFSPNGREVISVGDDGTLRLWDSQTGLLLRIYDPYDDLACECTFRLTSGKFKADGQAIWIGAENGPLRIMDVETGAVLAEDLRNVLEIVPDAERSRYAVIEPHSSLVTVWPTVGAFAPLHEVDTRFTVWNAAFVRNTQDLVIAGFVGAQLSVFDLATGEMTGTVQGSRVIHASQRGMLATQIIEWSDSDRQISLQISSAATGIAQYSTSLNSELTDVRFSPSGRLVAFSETDGALGIIHWRDEEVLLRVPPRGTALIGVVVTDLGLAASIDTGVGAIQTLTRLNTSTGTIVRLFDVVTGQEVTSFSTEVYGLQSADVLYWDNEFQRLIVANTNQSGVQLEMDPVTRTIRTVNSYSVSRLEESMFFDEHPDGLLRAEGPTTDDVRIYEIANFENLVMLRDAGPNVGFSVDGKLLLTSGPSGVIRLWGVPSAIPSAH